MNSEFVEIKLDDDVKQQQRYDPTYCIILCYAFGFIFEEVVIILWLFDLPNVNDSLLFFFIINHYLLVFDACHLIVFIKYYSNNVRLLNYKFIFILIGCYKIVLTQVGYSNHFFTNIFSITDNIFASVYSLHYCYVVLILGVYIHYIFKLSSR